MKTYVITLSKKFLGRHPRAGEETNFEQKFKTGQTCAKCKKIKRGMCLGECFPYTSAKLHTIRGGLLREQARRIRLVRGRERQQNQRDN